HTRARCLTENEQKAPDLQSGDEQSSPFAGFFPLVRQSLCSTLPTESCVGVPWYIASTGTSTSGLGRGAPRNREAQLGGVCWAPHKHLLTAQGQADMVTVSVPPECASA